MYLLVALIALQSVDAIADAAKFHQPNTEFTEADYFYNKITTTEHNPTSVNNAIDTQIGEQTSQESDDHCCYCHGVSCIDLTNNSLVFYALYGKEQSFFFKHKYISTHLSPDLRPPIV
jgi:hypothetical protein